MKTYITTSEAATKKLAATLAEKNDAKFICLYGDLGVGKTVFTKGYALKWGISEKKIKSPTYTFVREYKGEEGSLFHFDFYRIESLDDLMRHDLEEIFAKKDATIIIEWPERVQEILPDERTDVHIEYKGENERNITIRDHDAE